MLCCLWGHSTWGMDCEWMHIYKTYLMCLWHIICTYRHITSHRSCIRLESRQPPQTVTQRQYNWCGRGCDNTRIWQVKCFYLQGMRVSVHLCVFGFVCHMQRAGEGSLEHIGVRTWWLIIVANAYRDGSSDVRDSFKATHQDAFMHAQTHTHTQTETCSVTEPSIFVEFSILSQTLIREKQPLFAHPPAPTYPSHALYVWACVHTNV